MSLSLEIYAVMGDIKIKQTKIYMVYIKGNVTVL